MIKKHRVAAKAFPSFDVLIAAAEELADDVPDATLAGGLAMQIWGSPRLTADVDLVADHTPARSGLSLSFGGWRGTASNGVQVDVIVRDDEWADLYTDAFNSAETVEGSPLPVITPEYLVAMKMVAGRPKDEADVRFLVLTDDFDMETCRSIVRRHLGKYAVGDLRTIVDEAKWRRSRGEE